MLTELELRMATYGFVRRVIHLLTDAGWGIEARTLQSDLDRATADLPHLLAVRESAELLAAQLEAKQ